MNIAVINLLRIGDVFQSIPLINEILNNTNNITCIDLYTSNNDLNFLQKIIPKLNIIKIDIVKTTTTFRKNNFFHQFPENVNQFHSLKDKKYDFIYNLNSLKLSILLSDFLAIKNKSTVISGFTSILNNSFIYQYLHDISFNKKNGLINISELYITLAKNITNKKTIHKSSKKFYNEYKQKKEIALIIDTGDKIRDLSSNFYIKLITELLLNNNTKITLYGLNKKKSEKIMDLLNNNNLLNKVGQTTLEELYTSFENSDLIISPDTGSIHLAALTNTPIVGLYNVSAYYPLTAPYCNNLIIYPKLKCYPCEENFQPCGNLYCKQLFENNITNITNIINNYIENKSINETNEIGVAISDLNNFGLNWILNKDLTNNKELSNIQNLTKMVLFKDFSLELLPYNIFWNEIFIALKHFKNDIINLKIFLNNYLKKNNKFEFIRSLLKIS